MKLINFTKNLSKSILIYARVALYFCLSMGAVIFIFVVCLSVFGYIATLFGVPMPKPTDGSVDVWFVGYTVLGYCCFVVATILALVCAAIYSAYKVVKNIWEKS
jgi:hypothetical protein